MKCSQFLGSWFLVAIYLLRFEAILQLSVPIDERKQAETCTRPMGEVGGGGWCYKGGGGRKG